MAKLTTKDLTSPKEFKTAGGESVTLLIQPLSRIDKLAVSEALVAGELARAERLILQNSVRGWDGVQDEAGRPVTFSFDALNVALGCDDALGRAVSNHLYVSNGLAANTEGQNVPLDGTKSGSSANTSSVG